MGGRVFASELSRPRDGVGVSLYLPEAFNGGTVAELDDRTGYRGLGKTIPEGVSYESAMIWHGGRIDMAGGTIGNRLENLCIGGGGYQLTFSGATVNELVVANGGTVSGWGTLPETEVLWTGKSGGLGAAVISSGGVADGMQVQQGQQISQILAGGTCVNIVENGGRVWDEQVASGAMVTFAPVTFGGTISHSAGATVHSGTVFSSALVLTTLDVYDGDVNGCTIGGGTTGATMIMWGGAEWRSAGGGHAADCVVASRGSIEVARNAVAERITLRSGSNVIVYNGGTATFRQTPARHDGQYYYFTVTSADDAYVRAYPSATVVFGV